MAVAGPARADEHSPRQVVGHGAQFVAQSLWLKLDVVHFTPYAASQVLSGEDDLLLDANLDIRRHRAHLHLAFGDARVMAFGLDTQLAVGKDARVRARLDLGFAGHRLTLALPDVLVTAGSLRGQFDLRLTVPLIEFPF